MVGVIIVNNQNLPGFNPTQSSMNTTVVGNPTSQPIVVIRFLIHTELNWI